MWRRRSLDELTPREEEVLSLLRVGLTSEEIAQRLGISLNGARYHVSQILSKLGVATREEAAALAVTERQRWWAAWPLWAGAATAAVAVVGVAVLVYDPISGESEEDLPAESAPIVPVMSAGGGSDDPESYSDPEAGIVAQGPLCDGAGYWRAYEGGPSPEAAKAEAEKIWTPGEMRRACSLYCGRRPQRLSTPARWA